MPRKSRAEAAITKTTILERAVDLGSVEGLEALSIGRLAGELGMSKSGVIGHFGSKEDLQVAAVNVGIESFRNEIWLPVAELDPGIIRLTAAMDKWVGYLEREVFPGGCFMTAVAIEFDGRPGRVKQTVADSWAFWLKVLERDVKQAQEDGDLPTDIAADQIVFQLNAFVTQANMTKQLFGARKLDASRTAIAQLLSWPALAA
jgi:AcrR family transcriptional regulator